MLNPIPYVPHTREDIQAMLSKIGVKNLDDLFTDIPRDIEFKGNMELPTASDEMHVVKRLRMLSNKNANLKDYTCYLGGGIYHHYIPSVVNYVASLPQFYTAYTPYQPEVSQGTLQSFFEYQSMMCELLNMEVSNASMYDGASALAEAMLMASRITGKYEILISKTVHPEYVQVCKTYSRGPGIKIKMIPYDEKGKTDFEAIRGMINSNVSAVVVQTPSFFGIVESLAGLEELPSGILKIIVVNPLSLGILKPPGDFDADIVVGEGQPLGLSPSFGGPHFGIFATKKRFVRQMPGRVIGETVDEEGKRGFVMTLQTREQHIRRQKATSNICSNHAMGIITASAYLALLGKNGMRKLAELNTYKAHYLAQRFEDLNAFRLKFNAPFFNEFVVETHLNVDTLNMELLKHKIIGPLNLERFYPELRNTMLFAVTEMVERKDMDTLISKLKEM